MLVLLPGWNVTGDPALNQITNELRTLVDNLDAKTLRKNSTVRSDVMRDAERLAQKMERMGM
jgi:hypothetical protein